jgi:ribosomal protein S18 acetylase RimI-like enzyme
MVIHENEWPWGKTVTVIWSDGVATINMSFEKNNPGVCYLSGLSVIPERRREGLALIMMEECINYCQKHNIFRIDLNSVQRDWLMHFYHQLGFINIEENEGFMRMYKMLK